ncbi:hypothetical protein [Kitasatospora sp. NPDC057500]|uniref:hypothetical protein n=1 Tax=Kitasatospora sp. NPDC057500 TaxID=3346151 RepID=UPI0036C3A37C
MKLRFFALALAGAALSTMVTTAPAVADSHTRFYAYEDPQNPTRTKTIDVVPADAVNPQSSQQKVGSCKAVTIGRDVYNETGNTIQLFATNDCSGTATGQLPDGTEITDLSGIHSVKVLPN